MRQNPWERRLGGRIPLIPIETSAVCCPPLLKGRPVYDRLPGENGGFNINPTTAPVVLVGTTGADFINTTGSPTGVLGYPVEVPIRLSAFTLLFDSLYCAVFKTTELSLPKNVNGYIIADFFGRIYISYESPKNAEDGSGLYFSGNIFPETLSQSQLICDKLNYSAIVLYEFSTNDEIVTDVTDYRVFAADTNLPISAWLTEYFDDLFQEKREQIEVFFDDYLNPSTAGHFAIPCNAQLRSDFSVNEFLLARELWDNEIIYPPLEPQHINELIFYALTTHGILDWLAQHFGFIDSSEKGASNWHNGYGIFKPVDSPKLYFNIAQKRAILRNAFNFDQTLNENNELYQYPFSNFPEQNLWATSTWRGINYAKGSLQVFNFILDALGLHGTAPRLPSTTQIAPNYNWEQQPETWNGANSQWQVTGQNNSTSVIDPDQITPYLTPTSEDYSVPLRPFIKNDCLVDSGLYPSLSQNFARANYSYTKKPGSARAVYRVPLYWDRNGTEWKLLKEAKAVYANTDVLIGYQWFLPNKSLPGDPVCNYQQYTGARPETFTNPLDYVELNFFANIIDTLAIFGPQFSPQISIFPQKNTIFKYQISGNLFRASVPNDGNFYRYENKKSEVVKILMHNPHTLRTFTKWVRFTE